MGFTIDPRQVIETICDADYAYKTQLARDIVTIEDMQEFYYQAVVKDALCSLSEVVK